MNPSSGGEQNSLPVIGDPSGKTFMGHPRGLFLLFFVEMWERFSYYGMRGLLILYLAGALAAHQMAPSTYTNTLMVEQTLVATKQEKEAKVEHPTRRLAVPLGVTVSSKPASAAPTFGSQPLVQTVKKVNNPDKENDYDWVPDSSPLTLKFERLAKTPDPKQPGSFTWEPSGQSLSPIEFAAEAGKTTVGEPARFRVVNTGDHKVAIKLKLDRPHTPEAIAKDNELRNKDNPLTQIFFKVNDSTSVVTTTISTEADRIKNENPPYVITVDINRVDSGRTWMKADASTLYGWYTGMVYLLPILGGLIADKLIGTHRSMLVGAILITLGHVMLGVSGFGQWALNDTGMSIFVFGLALITAGTGHFKPSVSVMVGQLYPLGDARRESAFSIFYMGINLGAFTCNLACGWLSQNVGWHYGFAAAAIGMILGLGTYVIGRPKLLVGVGLPENDTHVGKAWMFLPLWIAAAGVFALAFHHGLLRSIDAVFSNDLVSYALIVAGIAYAAYYVSKQAPEDRGPVATIFIYMIFNMVFWLAFEQAGSSLNTFTDERTDRHLLGMEIPTTYFQSVNPLFIILLAPIFGVMWASLTRKNKNISQPVKIGIGLILVGLGYIVMVLAAMKLEAGVAKVSMVYICGCYFLHTVGEVILSPTGLSYVAKTAPKKALSSLMGMWFISSFIAGFVGGKLSGLVDPIIEGDVKLPWNFGGQADFFVLFVLTSVAAGVLMIAASPFLVRLQRNPRD